VVNKDFHNMKSVHWPLMDGLNYIWYSEEKTARGRSLPWRQGRRQRGEGRGSCSPNGGSPKIFSHYTYHSNAMGICVFVKNRFFRDFFPQIVTKLSPSLQ